MSKSHGFQISKSLKNFFYPEKKIISWSLNSQKKIEEFNANGDIVAAQVIAFLAKNKHVNKEKEESSSSEEVKEFEHHHEQTIDNSAGSRLSAVLHTTNIRMSMHEFGYTLNGSDAALSEIISESQSNNEGLLGVSVHLS